MPDLQADIARQLKQQSRATVPPGGTTGRVLTKTGPGDFETGWQLAARLPPGGAVGDVLTKYSIVDGAADWETPSAGGGSSTPTDWVAWEIPSTQGPYAWNAAEQEATWTDDLGTVSHGSAITLTSGHAHVATDGWYTISGSVTMRAVTASAVYDFARLRVKAYSSFTAGSDTINGDDIVTQVRPASGASGGVLYEAELPFVWSGYLKSGDDIRIYAQMSAASNPGSSWEVSGGYFAMMKLPMSGGGGGFPITEDDGTYTGSIDFNSSRTDGLVLTVTENAGSVLQSWVELSPANGVFLWSPVNDMSFETDAGGFLFDSTGASSTAFQVIDHSAKLIYLFSAAVTNDGGAVQIEAGSNGTGRGVVELTATGGMIFLDSSEVLFRGCTAAPTSADLSNNGDFGLWWDPATHVVSFKGRDSGGTIRNLTIGTAT